MIPLVFEDGLTGKVRFRRGWRGALVLQVEVNDSMWLGFVHRFKAFRDARVDDFLPGTLNAVSKLSAQAGEARSDETPKSGLARRASTRSPKGDAPNA